MNFNLDAIRDDYGFDATCQGSVPIAITAYLDKSSYPAEKALRLAISMGGDSDTIGAMTASIAAAERLNVIACNFKSEVIDKCRALLPAELLEINERFEAFISRPLYQSYYLHGHAYAGEYPGDKNEKMAKMKIKHMLHFGVKHFVDLTEDGELKPYSHLLPKGASYLRFPISDCGVPKSVESVNRLLDKIEDFEKMGGYTYIHCWGGVGRTGTIVGCKKAKEIPEKDGKEIFEILKNFFRDMPKAAYRKVSDTQEQVKFIMDFSQYIKDEKENNTSRVKDCIRGCLMAGAAGDALGYPVEFDSRKEIVAKYGSRGITQFVLDHQGKALVSDDTQMTLFTANGMLMGVTRGYMRGIGGQPEKYVDEAYLDWYYTQTGLKKEMLGGDWHYTWLRDLPELAHRRAPGNTCLSACEAILYQKEVKNNSKGDGGIMRVAPMALLMAGYKSRGGSFYDIPTMDEAGAEVARVTHKHLLGFLPAAMLTHLLYKLVPMSTHDVCREIDSIALKTIDSLDAIYKGEFEEDKRMLARLTKYAIELAKNDRTDAENIPLLGEGWTGEEAWAIALYCSVRHVDNMEEAIIASVNHDGDSDSTGSICGNIMGAIYGYEAIKRQGLFCPQGHDFESTIELSNLILALADDLYTSCIISEYDPIDTPEKRQWCERYCEMKPVGL